MLNMKKLDLGLNLQVYKEAGVLNTLQTSALFISSNTFDISLLVIGRSIPKISNLVSLISLAKLAMYNLIERF